jgi:hypothetical protein
MEAMHEPPVVLTSSPVVNNDSTNFRVGVFRLVFPHVLRQVHGC